MIHSAPWKARKMFSGQAHRDLRMMSKSSRYGVLRIMMMSLGIYSEDESCIVVLLNGAIVTHIGGET
jgi:hypothetical protein